MLLNKRYTTKLCFINKTFLLLSLIIAMCVIGPCTYLVIFHWSEMPLLMKISWPIVVLSFLSAFIVIPFNGLWITKNGCVVFVPDYRIKRVTLNELSRLAIVFQKWENNKYSVTVKFIYKDGGVFIKDYSKHFRNMKNQMLSKPAYTIRREKVQQIADKVKHIDACKITIVES